MNNDSVSVLGSGSWGTALAILLSQENRPAVLWGHNNQCIQDLKKNKSNICYLPGITFPDTLQLTSDLGEAASSSEDIIIAVPSHAFRRVLEELKHCLVPQSRITWATKGLEPSTHKLLHEVCDEVLHGEYPCAVISGPTFAREVASGLPTAITIASKDARFATEFARRLHSDTFRAYTTDDVIGVELGGALKNVLAIAAGISDGLGFGANSLAALITRGLVELSRLGQVLGGQAETFTGLAGLGDLVLTCTDDQSRNRRLGLGIAGGKDIDELFTEIGQVVEGFQTAREIHALAREHQVDMPICEQVYQVLHHGRDPRHAGAELLSRALKPEAILA
ncbi:MAG: NAD(P)H-dependent glycerol-3-phosphate dehydrogenase [Gammaproteobacteria bacterium]|nr:MAG: NAD(P)H-dependent glycerol-3-phosphate dehydrogenase [Gammaproteobacteria bacterium]